MLSRSQSNPFRAGRSFSRERPAGPLLWLPQLPREGRSPTWLERLIALRPCRQECCRPKLPTDRFGLPLWKRGVLKAFWVARYQPAALVEPFRKSFQAPQALRTERARDIQVELPAP